MTTTTFAIILLFISTVALFISVRSFYRLHKMDLLGKNFWRENGLKNTVLAIVWIMLFIGGISLLLEKTWASELTKTTFVLFWIAVLISWLYGLVGAIQLLRSKKDMQFSDLLEESPYTKEMLEKTLKPFNKFTEDGEDDSDLFTSLVEDSDSDFAEEVQEQARKMIVGKTIGFLVMTTILYLGWATL